MVESCKELHLICDKVLGSAPDFCVSRHYMPSILRLNTNMKNKQIFTPGVYYKGFENFTLQLCLLATKTKSSALLSASLPLKSLSSQDDEWISESGMSCRRLFYRWIFRWFSAYFTPFSTVFVVNFEQVNTDWE